MVAGVRSGPKPSPGTVTGAVLAGGRGTRMGGGPKPGVLLAGRALIERPLAAVAVVCTSVAVVCKEDTELPELPWGVVRWDEPAEPHHPLAGIVHALERAGGPALVCAADMPFVTPGTLRRLWERLDGQRTAVVGQAAGRLQPLLGAYSPAALPLLRDAAPDAPLTATVRGLDPDIVEVPERDAISVDTPQALERAEAYLRGLSA